MTTSSSQPSIGELYTQESRWQSWLDVEAALAQAQAKFDLVPAEAARAITAAARLDLLDRGRIEEASQRTGHALVPLIWELARVAGDEAGGWVHWGATSQNIMQTGDLLILRRAHRAFQELAERALLAMADLAVRSADMPMAGRTHGQHAVPMTFGYKVAAWIDEFLRHSQRLREVEKRIFVVLFGGAIGTFASMGSVGPAVQAEIGSILDMAPMNVPSRSSADHLAEYVSLLGLIAGTCGKIAREVYNLMKTEYGEVEEPVPAGTVGSSTMPQKRNPHLCQDIIAQSAIVRSAVPLALESMQMEHESDRGMSLIMIETSERACVATGEALSGLVTLVEGLELFPQRMRSNLDLSGGLIMAEHLMMALGETLGRQNAHDVVYEAAQAAAVSGTSFAALLMGDPRVSRHLDEKEIAEMLDPESYLGLSAELAREAATRARRWTLEQASRQRAD